MEEQDEQDKPDESKKPIRPSDWAKSDVKKNKKTTDDDLIEEKFDENGNLFIKLTIDDSALVVRSDGSVELVSHDLENSDNGYIGDVEDLNKTFSLVLALASALEDEDLYNRIFHNLNMTLMRKWDNMPDDIKHDIVEKKRSLEENRNEEEGEEKHKRIEEFRKRMNKYKETFLDDSDEEKRKMKKDLEDEKNFIKRHSRDFGQDMDSMMQDKMENMDDSMETRPKIKKKKVMRLKTGVNWNTHDNSLKAHWKEWRSDASPDEEE